MVNNRKFCSIFFLLTSDDGEAVLPGAPHLSRKKKDLKFSWDDRNHRHEEWGIQKVNIDILTII